MVNKSLLMASALVAVLVGLNYSGLVNKEVISSFMEKNEVTFSVYDLPSPVFVLSICQAFL
jgi:hypothetical protein